LNLVYHYTLNINHPVLANSFTIFHCSCLSSSLELVSSLSPMADIHRQTDHGDCPLYLAVYDAAHKGVQVIMVRLMWRLSSISCKLVVG